ncbi:MAG: DUF4093 domain-containing protein, partial [Oscillospiraceae bacterium]
LTDSDSAGFKIRSFIGGSIPQEEITHAYVPDIFGKEKRKIVPSKEGKLGVEGVPTQVIIEALEWAGVTCTSISEPTRKITSADFYEDGVSGGAKSKKLRTELLKALDLPTRLSTSSFLKLINIFTTYEEYKQIVEQCKNKINNN